ncbi:MAG: exopolysaccharide Pel transporter PelG [Candidatus Eremiobacterota bacterium]
MAGIGFKLRAYTQEGTLIGFTKAYFHAAMVASGPWILTVLSLVACQILIARAGLDHRKSQFLMETVIYIYAFTLITTAPLQLGIIRYLADQLDALRLDSHFPALISVTAISGIFHAVVGFTFMLGVETTWAYRLTATALFVLVSEVWVLMAFIGAVRAHHLVGTAFASGAVVAITMAILLPRTSLGWEPQEEVLAYLVALVLGQATILAIGLTALAREFEFHSRWNFDWWPYLKRYPALAISGFFYYLALWIGNFTYWFAPGPLRELMRPGYLWAFPPIDLAAFFAQMTILPAVIVFYVHTETDFYENYRGFFNAILARKGLDRVIAARQKMIKDLKDAFYSILVIQLTCTLGAMVFAPFLYGFYDFDHYRVHLFRVCALGAAPQVMLLFVLVVMYYFQFYRQALITTILAFTAAFLTALWTLRAGLEYYGIGLFVGCMLGLVVGSLWLFKRLHLLEYLIFTNQPVSEEVPFHPSMLTEGRFGVYSRKDGRTIERPRVRR